MWNLHSAFTQSAPYIRQLKHTAFALWLSVDTQGNSRAPHDFRYLFYIWDFVGLLQTQVIKLSVPSKRNLTGERPEDWEPCGVPNGRERPCNDIMIVWEWNMIIWRQLTGFIAVDTQWRQQYYNNNIVCIKHSICLKRTWQICLYLWAWFYGPVNTGLYLLSTKYNVWTDLVVYKK